MCVKVQQMPWLINVICLYCEVRVHPEEIWWMHASCDEEHPCFDDYCWMGEWWMMIMAEWMMKAWCMMILDQFVWKVTVCSDSLVFWRHIASPPSLWAVWNTPPSARETVEGPPSPSHRGYELLQPGSGSKWETHTQKQRN